MSEIQLVDSFKIYVPNDVEQYYLRMVNDSLIAGSTGEGSTLKLYNLTKNNEYRLYNTISLHEGRGILVRCNKDSAILVGEKNLLIYTLRDKLSKQYFTHEIKTFIDSSFSFKHEVISLPILRNDTFISAFYPVKSALYYEGVKEKAISIYKIGDTSLVKIKDAIAKPASLITNEDLRSFFCAAGNYITLIYSGFDTIYTLNLNTLEERKLPIGNVFYRQPDTFRHSMNRDQEYTTDYYYNNFAYIGLFYNENTEHYVLFFNAPYIDEEKKYPVNKYALVIDKEFRILNYYRLGNAYPNPVAFINMKNKGIALKLANTLGYDSAHSYHVYNF